MIILWLLECYFVIIGLLLVIGFLICLFEKNIFQDWHDLVFQMLALPFFIALVLHILRVL